MEREGARAEGPELILAGNPGSRGTEQQGGTRPKPAGLYALRTLSCGGPAPLPSRVLPLTLPPGPTP